MKKIVIENNKDDLSAMKKYYTKKNTKSDYEGESLYEDESFYDDYLNTDDDEYCILEEIEVDEDNNFREEIDGDKLSKKPKTKNQITDTLKNNYKTEKFLNQKTGKEYIKTQPIYESVTEKQKIQMKMGLRKAQDFYNDKENTRSIPLYDYNGNIKEPENINIIKNIHKNNEKQMSLFKKLGSYVETMISFTYMNSKERTSQKTINTLIDNGMLGNVLQIISDGYILKGNLATKFEEKMYELIHTEKEGLNLLEKLLREEVQIEPKFLIELSLHKEGHKAYEEIIGYKFEVQYPNIAEKITTCLKNEDFKRSLFIYWQNQLNTSVNILLNKKNNSNYEHHYDKITYYNMYNNNLKTIFSGASLEESLESINQILKYSKDIVNFESSLKGKKAEIFKAKYELKAMVAPILNHVASDLITLTTERKTQKKKIVDAIMVDKSLPESAEKIVNKINMYYMKMKDNAYIMDEIEKNDMENIMNKRLVETLDTYWSIDKKCRNTMKNIQGKTAEELLLQSLNNIREVLLKMIENINENKLRSLSINQRHTETIKHNYGEITTNIEETIETDLNKKQEEPKTFNEEIKDMIFATRVENKISNANVNALDNLEHSRSIEKRIKFKI